MRVWPLSRYSSRRLPFPGGRVVVVLADALVELAGDAADGRLVADVGLPESAGGQPAQPALGSISTTVLPMRFACTAAATPPDVPP